MSLPALAAALALALSAPTAAAPAADLPQAGKNIEAVKKYYDDALKAYAAEDYRAAIIKWNEVLREDPEQKTAPEMILQARAKIAVLTRQRRRKAFDLISAGRYRDALQEIQSLLDQDPGDPQLEALRGRLEGVIRLSPSLAPADKAARAAVLGLKGYLVLPQDLRLAHNGLRYACELASDHRYDPYLALLLADSPELAREDAVTPGMRLLQYKHVAALNFIYDAKYTQAVSTLEEILALEPLDLLALKRLGSAYYALGSMEQAEKVWAAALARAPDDATLRHYLEKARRYKSTARTP